MKIQNKFEKKSLRSVAQRAGAKLNIKKNKHTDWKETVLHTKAVEGFATY